MIFGRRFLPDKYEQMYDNTYDLTVFHILLKTRPFGIFRKGGFFIRFYRYQFKPDNYPKKPGIYKVIAFFLWKTVFNPNFANEKITDKLKTDTKRTG